MLQVTGLLPNQAGAPVFPGILADHLPSTALVSLTTMDKNLQNAYSKQASIEVERVPRPIRIHRLELVAGGASPEFEVACSKGTYVRTLAEDIARSLGTVGHVASLRRLALGPFRGEGMRTLETVERHAAEGSSLGLLLPVDQALPGLPAVQLGAAEQDWVLQGRPVPVRGPSDSRVRMYGVGGRFLGVGRMSGEGARLAPERIMVEVPVQATSRA